MKQYIQSCGKCGATNLRLYRPYGEFRRPERDRCNACITEKERSFYVPLILDDDNSAWGNTSVPQNAIKQFLALPEKDNKKPTWINTQGWSDK